MPHLEANCRKRKTLEEMIEFLYNIIKLNDHESDSTEKQTDYVINDQENEDYEIK